MRTDFNGICLLIPTTTTKIHVFFFQIKEMPHPHIKTHIHNSVNLVDYIAPFEMIFALNSGIFLSFHFHKMNFPFWTMCHAFGFHIHVFIFSILVLFAYLFIYKWHRPNPINLNSIPKKNIQILWVLCSEFINIFQQFYCS